MNILIAGDFCPQLRVAKAFEREDYSSVLSEVQAATKKADYSIVNFECPVVSGAAKPIEKIGPNLRCTANGVKAIKYAGFDCATLANNHFFDYGEEGVAETIATLNKEGVEHVGGGMDLNEASRVLYKEIDGKRLAVINCCEHEFSIATETSAGSNPLNPIQQYYAIKEAKTKADYVLVIVHGGHEHWQLPSPRMVETYRFFIEVGADAVVNHHQHCYSGFEVYQGKPIFYGLGNFCFDKSNHRNDFWNEGYMAMLSFDEAISYEILPYHQCSNDPKVVLLPKNAFELELIRLNKILTDKKSLCEETEKHYASAIRYGDFLEPIRMKVYKACKKHDLLPSFVSKSRKLEARNFIQSEAHRDILQWYLEH